MIWWPVLRNLSPYLREWEAIKEFLSRLMVDMIREGLLSNGEWSIVGQK